MTTYICLIDIDKRVLQIDPVIQSREVTTFAVFQFGDEIILFERNHQIILFEKKNRYWNRSYCIKIDTGMMKLYYLDGYQEMAKQLGNTKDIIAFKDGDGFIVGGTRRDDRSVILVNSHGLLLYKSDPWHAMSTSSSIAYDEYTNSVMIKIVDESQKRKICRVYKQEGKWIAEEMERGFNCTTLFLITRKKMLLGNSEEFIVCDKKTIEITSNFPIDEQSVAFHYDFYDKWFNNELRRLLNIHVLGRMSRDILTLILLYIS